MSSWLPVGLWLIWIFFSASDSFSGAHTSRIIDPFLHWLFPTMSWRTIQTIHLVIRKCGHLTEYGVLAILLWRAINRQSAKWGSRFAVVAVSVLVLITICASIDEFHQSFVPSRTSSAHDVMIDGAGAMAGLLLIWWSERRRMRKRLTGVTRTGRFGRWWA